MNTLSINDLSISARRGFWAFIATTLLLVCFGGPLAIALFGCATAKVAELTYTGELLACTAQAKATEAGRAGSEACERDVDKRWHIVADGGDQ